MNANNIYINDNVMLGHTRLSIIDNDEKSNQPFIFNNLVMVFNGEIYNYIKLKQILIDNYNCKFITNSDTEVLIQLFYYLGVDKTLELLEGMFVIILYNKDTNNIIMVRDRLGEKLLYYYEDKDILIFASNPSSIAKTVNLYFNKIWNINKYTFFYYLSSGMFPTRMCLFEDIFGLKPGYYISYNCNTFTQEYIKYWLFKENNNNNYYDLLKNIIIDCENRDNNIDTKILFSGGIDSGIVAFFENNSSYITLETDELHYSKMFLQNINKENKQHIIDKDFIKNNLEKSINIQQKIIGDTGLFTRSSFAVIITGLYLEKYHPNTKCIITGNGGDELFYGYYIMHNNNSKYNNHINEKFIFNQFISPLNNEYKNYFIDKYMPNFESNILQELDIPDNLHIDNIPRWIELKTYLLNDLNIDSDVIFMNFLIECRSPFLNHKLVEYCLSNNPDTFFYDYDNSNYNSYINNSKKPLKEILLQKIDKTNIFREKYGYGLDDEMYIQYYKILANDFFKRELIKCDNYTNQYIILVATLEMWFKEFANIIKI
jgi:asparagine synthase (glutamine-hydrolysing)